MGWTGRVRSGRRGAVLPVALAALLLMLLLLLRAPLAPGVAPERSPGPGERVAPGVTLWERPLGGMEAGALRAWLRGVAPLLVRPPQDARVDPVTRGAIPDLNGAVLDVEATSEAVLRAAPGTAILPVFRQLPAAVRLDALPDRVLYRGHPDLREVSLLVNVAWGNEELPALLDALRAAGASATFFLVGRWAERFPDLAAAIAAAGHEVASHGYSDAVELENLSEEAVADDFRRAAEVVESVTGVRPRFVSTHRGVLTPAIARAAARTGQRLVMWTVDTVDWRDPPPSRIVDRVRSRVVPGALILAHPRAVTVTAVPQLVAALRERGYEPVPLGALVDPTLRPYLLPQLPPPPN